MPHDQQLLLTITLGLSAATIGGFLAAKLRLPPLVGYLLAGVALGPFTPGYTVNPEIASQLAEIGIILLMFGVGMHFSLDDLKRVTGIVVPGAFLQISMTVLLGSAVASFWGWTGYAALFMGLSVSIASTVVLLRALTEHDLVASPGGHIAIGWALVQDIFVVILLVLLPTLLPIFKDGAGIDSAALAQIAQALGLTMGKVALFIALMALVGTRLLPWLLEQLADTGSRELFTLGVMTVALGVAVGAADIFGISIALGAFLAGFVMSESESSHQAAEDALPLRDAFAVLFFVSVGMLLNPVVLVENFGAIVMLVGVIMIVNPLVGGLATLVLGQSFRSALVVGAGLAQIGEFSFILSEMGRQLGLLPDVEYNVILATAIASIVINPFIFRTVRPLEQWIRQHRTLGPLMGKLERAPEPDEALSDQELRNHTIFCGYGTLGFLISQALERRGFSYAVLEHDRNEIADLTERGVLAIYGDPGNTFLLGRLRIDHARVLVVLEPDPVIARHIVRYAKQANPRLDIVTTAINREQRLELQAAGSDEAVLGDLEVALEVTRHVLHRFGVSAQEIQLVLSHIRGITV